MLHNGSNGFTINITADPTADPGRVVLRGLDINGAGPGISGCPLRSGPYGVHVVNARSVLIEDTRISNSTAAGVRVDASAAAPAVTLNRVSLSGHRADAVEVGVSGIGTSSLFLRDSIITDSKTGVRAGANGRVWLENSLISGNAMGIEADAGGRIDAFADTRLAGNTIDGTPSAILGAAAAGPAGPAGPVGPAGPIGATGAEGARGPAGVPSRVRLVTCTIRAGGKRCSARLLGGTVTVRASSRVTATLRRIGRALPVSVSLAPAGGLRLRAKRSVPAGSYWLRIRITDIDGTTRIAMRRVTISAGR